MRPHPMFMLLGTGLPAYTLGASPGSASASQPYTGSPLTTAAVTVSQASGPPATLSYAWSYVSGSGGITANSPSLATTTFSGNPSESSSISAVFRCTATRAGDGATAAIDVPVTITAGLGSLTISGFPEGFVTSHDHGSPYTLDFSGGVSGGDGAYTWSNGCIGGSMTNGNTSSPSISVAPGGVGTSSSPTVTVSVHDGSGRSANKTIGITINWT